MLHEDAQGDLSAYQTAGNILGKLFRYLWHGDPHDHYGFRLLRFSDGQIMLTLRGSDIGLSSDDAMLWLCFGQQKGYAPSGNFSRFSKSGEPSVTVLCLEDLQDIEQAQKRILHNHQVHNVLLHEITHYLDSKRNPAILHKKENETPDSDAYYNNPAEFNAYFTNLATPLLTVLRAAKEDPTIAKRMATGLGVGRDFQANLAMMISKAAQQSHPALIKFYQRLSERNRRALLKRLYNLHQQIIAYLDNT